MSTIQSIDLVEAERAHDLVKETILRAKKENVL